MQPIEPSSDGSEAPERSEPLDRPLFIEVRESSPAAMAWLDRAIRTLIRATHPRRGMEAAAEARDAARSLASSLGVNEVPFGSVERRIDALVRLDVPDDDRSPRRRKLLADQLRHWASEAYVEARLRIRRPDDLP